MHKKIKILFIGDPLSSLKLASDTSLAFCEEALKLDFEVFWCEKKDISFINSEIFINQLSVITQCSIDALEYHEFSSKNSKQNMGIAFSKFSYCFIRTDPPFDESYKDLCWILNTQTKVKIYNPPSALLNFHEKSLHWHAFTEGVLTKKNLIPTCLSESRKMVKEFLNIEQKKGTDKFITKPWLGHGGNDIILWENTEKLLDYFHSTPHKLMIQPFLKEIYKVGDRRVIIANGKVMCSFVRLPSEGKIASNIAQGGKGVLLDMTPVQKELCNKIGRFLLKHSIAFAGLDLIGEKIGEINITSPTGIRVYENLTGKKITQKIFASLVNN